LGLQNLQRLVPILVLGLSIAGIASGQTGGFDESTFADRVARMHASTSVPGMSVAVVQDGEVLHLGGYGVAGPDGRPVTGQTSLQVGSVTKSMTALVVLQLAAEGKLDLDAPVVEHLPGFRTADRSASDRITIDHLVTHRSGLTTLAGNRRQARTGREAEGPARAVEDLATEALAAEPGHRFQYSNANYAILTHLIETVEGRPFEQVLASRILEPLGMEDSFVRHPESGSPDVASGHRSWFGWARPTDVVLDRHMAGAGAVVASAEDMARYVIALQTRDARIVPESADRLFESQPIRGPFGYAYGWHVFRDPDGDLISHTGATPGFNSIVVMGPATGRAVVVLTNQFGILNGRLPQAVAHEALGLEPVEPGAPLSAHLGLWSGLGLVVGILLWVVKTGRRLWRPTPIRTWVRWLNVGAVVALAGGVVAVWILFPGVAGLSIASGRLYFPDVMLLLYTSCGLAIALAVGCAGFAERAHAAEATAGSMARPAASLRSSMATISSGFAMATMSRSPSSRSGIHV